MARGKSEQMTPADVATAMADAKGWQPEKGDEIEGIVLGVKWGFSELKNDHYPIVFVLKDDGDAAAVHGFQTVLNNELRQQRPLPGEPIYIKFLGPDEERAVKPGQSPVMRYAVVVTRDGQSNDPWGHMPS
jgi:hypothetical protein